MGGLSGRGGSALRGPQGATFFVFFRPPRRPRLFVVVGPRGPFADPRAFKNGPRMKHCFGWTPGGVWGRIWSRFRSVRRGAGRPEARKAERTVVGAEPSRSATIFDASPQLQHVMIVSPCHQAGKPSGEVSRAREARRDDEGGWPETRWRGEKLGKRRIVGPSGGNSNVGKPEGARAQTRARSGSPSQRNKRAPAYVGRRCGGTVAKDIYSM